MIHYQHIKTSKKIKRILVLFFLLLINLLLVIKLLDTIKFKCIYRYLFNIYCAGCGVTRMIKSVLKLDFCQAFRYNPLFFILSIFFLIYIIVNIYLYLKKDIIIKINFKVVIFIIIILIIYTIIINTNTFSYLRPTKI